jgi:hypothetical protein
MKKSKIMGFRVFKIKLQRDFRQMSTIVGVHTFGRVLGKKIYKNSPIQKFLLVAFLKFHQRQTKIHWQNDEIGNDNYPETPIYCTNDRWL